MLNPYFLLLLLLPLFFLFFKKKRFFLKHSCCDFFTTEKKATWQFLSWFGWILLVLASLGIYFSFQEKTRIELVRKYVLINDGSGSMIESNKKNGVGENLTKVINANRKFLSLLEKSDLLGAIAFSSDAFIISYLVEDKEFVWEKLININYLEPPMNLGTELDKALFAGIGMLAEQQIPPELVSRLYGTGTELTRDKVVEEFLKKDLRGSLVIFTDGEFGLLAGDKFVMSIYKLLDLCKFAKIKVYFISLGMIDERIASKIVTTGGKVTILRNLTEKNLTIAYEDILRTQQVDYKVIERTINKSLTKVFACFGLLFLVIGFLLGKNFTNI